jgi:hypothetical protein
MSTLLSKSHKNNIREGIRGYWIKKLGNLPERLWSRVDKSAGDEECWPFTGRIGANGYPYFSFNGKLYKGNRLAYSLTYGEVPKGLFICHCCNNPICCNPKHLYAGTNKDNMRDMVRAGRWGKKRNVVKTKKGEQHYNHKLTGEQVLEIRNSKDNYSKLAKEYGVNISAVCKVKKRYTWKHI